MSYDTATPYVACFVLLRKDDKIALLLRSNTPWMNGYYGLPSGKLEKDERIVAAAVREAKEEAGVTISEADLRCVLTAHRKGTDGTFWVDVYFEADSYQGEPYNVEQHVHSELAWFDLKDLPENIIPSVRHELECIAAGKPYTEFGWNGEGD